MSRQSKLNEITHMRVLDMVNRNAPNVRQSLMTIEKESRQQKDYQVLTGNNTGIVFTDVANVRAKINGQNYSLNKHAVGQIAAKMEIPPQYLRGLMDGDQKQRALAVRILNDHVGWSEKDRLLVRTVGGEIRGVLSNSYQRISTFKLLEAFLNEARLRGAKITDLFLSPTRIWVEVILPDPIVIPTQANDVVIIYMGARFSSSDYGDGKLEMRAFLLNGVCTNGLVRESIVSKYHRAGRISEDLEISERTARLDSATWASSISDMTKNLFNQDNFHRRALEIQAASTRGVDFAEELNRLYKNKSLTEGESKEINAVLLRNSLDDGLAGEPTLWKFAQGMTAFARDLEDGERKRELQVLAGNYLSSQRLKA